MLPSGRPGIGSLVAAVLLPPLGIFLGRGIGMTFWIGALLTLIGIVPGIVFALIVLLRPGLFAKA